MKSDSIKNNDNLLTLYLREASMLQPTFSIIWDSFSTSGVMIDLHENTKGRDGKTDKIILQIDSIPPLELSPICGVEFSLSSSGSIKFTAVAIYIDGIIPMVELSSLQEISIEEQRHSRRIKLENAKKTFVILETNKSLEIGSFKLENISPKTIGGTLFTNRDLNDHELYTISGKISLGGHSICVSNAQIIRLNKVKSSLQKKIREYDIAFSVHSRSDSVSKGKNRRMSERTRKHDEMATISLKSNLGTTEVFNAQVVDISAGGFSAKILSSNNRLHILPGSEILFAFSNLRGRVIENREEIFRVRWEFEDTSDKVIWSKFISTLLRNDVVIGSYENESVLTLLARSGIKSAAFLKNYHTLTSMVSEIGDIDSKGDIVSYKWINKDTTNRTIAHVGAFKIADNLWFMGDLFASLETEKGQTKDFVKEYLSGFIDFSNYVSPYPKLLTAWTVGHPYWKKLEENLKKNENKDIIHSSVTGVTITPDVLEVYNKDDSHTSEEIKAADLEKINEIRQQGQILGFVGFFDAFNFCVDSFASPHLRSLLRSQGYKFFRYYYNFKINNSSFLIIISNLPEGLSPQRHQSAVWIFSLDRLSCKTDVSAAIRFSTVKATEVSTFPSIVRVVGNNLELIYPEKLSRMVIAAPRIWGLT